MVGPPSFEFAQCGIYYWLRTISLKLQYGLEGSEGHTFDCYPFRGSFQ
jgi:hypothetical protein